MVNAPAFSGANVRKRATDYRMKYGIDITVIDDSDYVGWFASAGRTDEIYMKDVKSMVQRVLKKKGTYKIRRLNIIDHGNSTSLQIGKDWLSTATLTKFEPQLSKLNGAFNASGYVHLQHCDTGLNRELMTRLAKIFGVSVYAGTGAHNPLFRFNFGDYVRADPNGSFDHANRPGLHVRRIDPGDLELVKDPSKPTIRRAIYEIEAKEHPNWKP
jgi:hypothetical protein